MEISLSISLEECLKTWHVFWHIGTPSWNIGSPYGTLARQLETLDYLMTRWHVNHAGIQACWHLDYVGT